MALSLHFYKDKEGLLIRCFSGDGNCLFQALSKQLTLTEENHSMIREKVVNMEAANAHYFASRVRTFQHFMSSWKSLKGH